MARRGRSGRIALAGMLTGLALYAPGTASAALPECTYDPAEHELTVRVVDGEGATFEVYMDQIWITGDNVLEQVTCDGGTPTPTNVDRVKVRKTAGFTGSSRLFFFDSAIFGTGYSDAGDEGPDAAPEIEWNLKMGTAPKDSFRLQTADGIPSSFRFGSAGINVNPDAEPLAPDVDFKLKGIDALFTSGGNASTLDLDASGGGILGDPTPLGFDVDPKRSNYGMVGSLGSDTLIGGDGDDEIKGLDGVDEIVGGRGDDKLNSVDHDDPAADPAIDCGTGADRAKIDTNDPEPIDCERVKSV